MYIHVSKYKYDKNNMKNPLEKKNTTTNVGEAVGEKKPSYTTCGN
jgi:hypothetical protein